MIHNQILKQLAMAVWCCCLLASAANCQEPDNSVSIPFSLNEANNMVIDATINKTDRVKLMFHTAASNVTLTANAVKRCKSLDLSQTGNMRSWGGESTTRFGSGNSLQVGSLKNEPVTVFEDKHSGPGTDGKFGPDFFSDKVIEFEFEKKKLVVHPSMPELEPGFVKLDLKFERGNWFVDAAIDIGGKTFVDSFMIHSGFGGTALISKQTAERHKLSDELKTVSERELKDSLGNKLTVRKVTAPGFKLGPSNFEDLPVELFPGGNVIGCELLRCYRMIVDRKGKTVYLKRNDNRIDS